MPPGTVPCGPIPAAGTGRGDERNDVDRFRGEAGAGGHRRRRRGQRLPPRARPEARPARRAGRRLRYRPRPARTPGPRVGDRADLHRPDGRLQRRRHRRIDHRHAQLHPRPDRPGGGAGGQAPHVREAPRAERRRSPHDVRGGPRRGRRPHDGVHVPLRPRDALPEASRSTAAPWGPPGISAPSASSTGPRRAGDGGSTARRPAPATCTT